MGAEAIPALRRGGGAAGWGRAKLTFFRAAWVLAAVLSPGVHARTDGAGWGLIGAGLVWVSEAVTVTAVCGRVGGVDGCDFAGA